MHAHTPVYVQRHMKAANGNLQENESKDSIRNVQKMKDKEQKSVLTQKIRQKLTNPHKKFKQTGNDTLSEESIHKR